MPDRSEEAQICTMRDRALAAEPRGRNSKREGFHFGDDPMSRHDLPSQPPLQNPAAWHGAHDTV